MNQLSSHILGICEVAGTGHKLHPHFQSSNPYSGDSGAVWTPLTDPSVSFGGRLLQIHLARSNEPDKYQLLITFSRYVNHLV